MSLKFWFRFFSEVFEIHLGISDKKLDPPSGNVTLWHVFKTITMRPSTKHVSICLKCFN